MIIASVVKNVTVLHDIFWSDLDFQKDHKEAFSKRGTQMGKIYTEYKSSKYDEYLKARTPQNGLGLNVYSNRVDINCETQSVLINTDLCNDFVYKDYQTHDLDPDFDFILNLNNLMVNIFDDFIWDINDYKKIFVDKQKHKADYDRINFRFLNDEDIKKSFIR